MPSRVAFDWNGDRLLERVRSAAREAVDATVDAARDDAETTHAWKVDPKPRRLRKGGPLVNPDLQSQIKSEHADPGDANPTARFGYTKRKGFYGLFHEEGTIHEFNHPALRPAADRQFPALAERICGRLNK